MSRSGGASQDAARLVESRNQNVTATLLQWAFPALSEDAAQEYAVLVNMKRDLHGEGAAILYVHELARRLNP